MKRRAILLGAGATFASLAMPGLAQAPKSIPRVAFMHPGSSAAVGPLLDTFRSTLKSLGYTEGRNLSIEVYWAEDERERIPALAAGIVAAKPQVIVTATSAAVAAFMKATSTIPIVFATAGRPVEQGFAASLKRPGGNVTGVMLYSNLSVKLIDVVREAMPEARRLAMLAHERDPAYRQEVDGFEERARRVKFEPTLMRVAGTADFDRAFAELASRKCEALITPQLVLFQSRAADVARRCIKGRIGMFSAHDGATEALVSYSTPRDENYKRSAALVDKILRGAKAGDLPIEQPDRFRLALNLHTARAIGVKFPQTLVARADEVFQ